MSHRIAAAAIAAIAVLGLTACTPPASGGPTSSVSDAPGDDGQSKAQACDLVQASIEDATAEFENATTDDPAAAVESMKGAAARIADTATQITNDEVAAVLPAVQAMFTDAAEVMEAIVSGDASRIEDLNGLGAQFQETSATFQEICTS